MLLPPSAVVASFSHGLMASSPERPANHIPDLRWTPPQPLPQQFAHFRDGQRDQGGCRLYIHSLSRFRVFTPDGSPAWAHSTVKYACTSSRTASASHAGRIAISPTGPQTVFLSRSSCTRPGFMDQNGLDGVADRNILQITTVVLDGYCQKAGQDAYSVGVLTGEAMAVDQICDCR
jgi:hypothetical protein